MGSEQGDGLFVFRRELPASLLLGEVDVAQPLGVVEDWATQKALHRRVAFGKPDGLGVAGDVPEAQRSMNLAEVAQQPQTLRLGPDVRGLSGGDAGGDEALNVAEVVQYQERTVPGAGQRAGSVYDALQHGIDVQVLGDAKGGLAQPGKMGSQRLYLPPELGGFLKAGARPRDRQRFLAPCTHGRLYRLQRKIITKGRQRHNTCMPLHTRVSHRLCWLVLSVATLPALAYGARVGPVLDTEG